MRWSLLLGLGCAGSTSVPQTDSADTGTSMSATNSTTPPQTTTTSADLAVGCLDAPCTLASVAATGTAACADASGNDPEAHFEFGEQRGAEAFPGINASCVSSGLTAESCTSLCEGLGMPNLQFSENINTCFCAAEATSEAAFAEELAALTCTPGTATVSLYATRSTPLTNGVIVTCRGGAAGTGACEDVRTTVNQELGTSLGTAVDFGAGCSVSD